MFQYVVQFSVKNLLTVVRHNWKGFERYIKPTFSLLMHRLLCHSLSIYLNFSFSYPQIINSRICLYNGFLTLKCRRFYIHFWNILKFSFCYPTLKFQDGSLDWNIFIQLGLFILSFHSELSHCSCMRQTTHNEFYYTRHSYIINIKYFIKSKYILSFDFKFSLKVMEIELTCVRPWKLTQC